MRKFKVCVRVVWNGTIEIEANSADEARDKAANLPFEKIDEHAGDVDVEITDVSE